ncbi:MAG: GNAT family N-acetyltransferase [Desulfobacteraceae bacterium]|nr:GNAT family N-acetyltransferase [Desulfobacteraceae bacterium]
MSDHQQGEKEPLLDPDWRTRYQARLRSAREAVREIRSGQRVFIGTGCAEPQPLVQALMERAHELQDLEILHLLTKGDAPYAAPEHADRFRVNSFFIGQNVRDQIQAGLGDYTPVLLSDIPRLFDSGQIPIDVALIQVSPPDHRGRVSLGISVDIVKSAAENASRVIALINAQMPYTLGDSLLDIDDLDTLVAADLPILERPTKPAHPATDRIARHIAALIQDGDTLQFGLGRIPGIGRIPPAVMSHLLDKKDLGVHTEMITDSIIRLVEAGVVTGRKKTLDRGRIVASFCMGTRRLYELVDRNPLFAFKPSEYVNDPLIISRQERMVAINMAMQIDLTGQVCSDSAGDKFYSGIGGQIDFHWGAARSPGGKAIIVLSALDEHSRDSRIVARLSPGSGVSITRGEVRYVVSEYGVAYLHGKSVQERALALISIAHPDFRERLFKEAIEQKLIRAEHAQMQAGFVVNTGDRRRVVVLADGTEAGLRPILPTDEQGIKELMYSLSQDTLYQRFMNRYQQFGAKQLLDFIYVDHRQNVALVLTIPEARGEEIIAVARYFLDEASNRAEVAFLVRDDWQGRGIGKLLLEALVVISKRSGLRGFTALVLRDNRKMQAVFNHSGLTVKSFLEDDVYRFEMDF